MPQTAAPDLQVRVLYLQTVVQGKVLVAFACGEQQVTCSFCITGFVARHLSAFYRCRLQVLSDPDKLPPGLGQLGEEPHTHTQTIISRFIGAVGSYSQSKLHLTQERRTGCYTVVNTAVKCPGFKHTQNSWMLLESVVKQLFEWIFSQFDPQDHSYITAGSGTTGCNS